VQERVVRHHAQAQLQALMEASLPSKKKRKEQASPPLSGLEETSHALLLLSHSGPAGPPDTEGPTCEGSRVARAERAVDDFLRFRTSFERVRGATTRVLALRRARSRAMMT
jgi:hypothetical protein